jgi:hypothetical protein
MLFDRLAKIVEVHLPKYTKILQRARIFEFPVVPHKTLPKSFTGDIEWLEQNFFLPFPSVAVEDNASCVVIFDIEKNQKGTIKQRGYLECMSLAADSSNFRESLYSNIKEEKSPEMIMLHQQGYCIVNVGFIEKMTFETPEKFYGEGDIIETMVASKKDIYIKDLHKANATKSEGLITNVYSTIQEIMYFNQADKFILEEKPLVMKKRKKKFQDKILRSHERPKYTILSPNKIRERMKLPQLQVKKGSPIPHERRRHDRWLSDARYSKDENGKPRKEKIIPYGRRKGEIYYLHVDVPPVWIGPSENKIGNKHYKVLVNK